MTDFANYQQAREAFFAKHPDGRISWRGHLDSLNPDYGDRRSTFIFVCTQPLSDDYNHFEDPENAWSYDEALTLLWWKEHAERFDGCCNLHSCNTKVTLGVSFCDPCQAAMLLDSSLFKKVSAERLANDDKFARILEDTRKLAAQSPYVPYDKRKHGS